MDNLEKLEQQAINAAINAQWQNAINLNKEIVSIDETNIDAYLRLGFACLQLNKFREAKKYYNKALKLQPGNQIACQNLEKIKILERKAGLCEEKKPISLDPNLFLEIPGKTKSVALVNLGQKDIIARLTTGREVALKVKKRKIEIRTKNNDYAGSLPDDISKRLIIFIKAGNKYSAFIKEVNLNRVVVFLREDRKGRRAQRYTSFPQFSQPFISEIPQEEGKETAEEEEVAENDLDKLAENLISEEKIYIPSYHEEEEEGEEE